MKSMTIAAHNKWSTCAPLTTTVAAYAKRQLNASQKGYQNPKGSERKQQPQKLHWRQPHWQYVAHVWLNIVWRLQRGNKQQVALSKEQTNWNLAKFGVAQLSKKRLLGIVDQKLTATYRYALRVTSPY